MSIDGRVLVTGATGFLGSHLVHRLLAGGAEVHVLARATSSFERLHDVGSRLVRWTGDVTDRESLQRCLGSAQPAIVFHLAGHTAGRRFEGDWSQVERAIADNFLGTIALLRAAETSGAPIRSVIRTGGLEEYGAGPTPYAETQREQPRSPYSASQVSATHWCKMLQPQLPFAVVTLRPALTYGPAQSVDFLIPALITALLRGERFPMTDGTQRRDLLYVDDFVDAALRAAAHPDLRGTILNVATAEEHSMGDVAATIAQQLGAEHLVQRGALPARAGELMHLVARTDEALRTLGWRPATPLALGLARTIAWYRDRKGTR